MLKMRSTPRFEVLIHLRQTDAGHLVVLDHAPQGGQGQDPGAGLLSRSRKDK